MAKWVGAVLLVVTLVAGGYWLGRSHGAESPKLQTISLDEFQAGIDRAGVWSGGPEEFRDSTGRLSLAEAITHGLMPDDKLLDIGAGSLRIGWWFLQYVNPSNYYAIEPVESRIDTAIELMGVKINSYHNTDFDFPDAEFDFVFARSIWTHASKPMISKMLSEFVEHSAPDAKFLTSVIFARSARDDYLGEEWVGKVHKDDAGGFAMHSKDWIDAECDRWGLRCVEVGVLHGQVWLLIEKTENDPEDR